ncbi:MAG: NAD(P)H-binding protein [Chitinivibrionales bacterium]|nr:NAD(P)H-binding protein [Chitinivibrionales bacterium]
MDRSKTTILVTGATGRQGGAVARHLLADGWRVRAFTRHPESEAAKNLQSLGAEIVHGDLDKPESVRDALEGTYGVFSVQNTWEHGVDKEIEQGTRLAELASETGIEHFVYSSVGSAEDHTGIPHFDSKWQIENHIRSLGLRFTIVRPVFFMENLLMPDTKRGIDEGTLALGMEPERPMQVIAVDDIGEAVAQIFAEPDRYIGKELELAGDELTGTQMADVLTHTTGHDVHYYQIPLEQIRSFSEDYAIMVQWFNEHGYHADISRVKQMVPRVHSLEDWARETRGLMIAD